MKKYILLGFNI